MKLRFGNGRSSDVSHIPLTDRLLLRLTGYDLGTAPTRVYITVLVLMCFLLTPMVSGVVFAAGTGIQRYRQAAAEDPRARQKAFREDDPIGAKACDLINEWLRGRGQDPLEQAFVFAEHSDDIYIRINAGEAGGLEAACARAGAIMER